MRKKVSLLLLTLLLLFFYSSGQKNSNGNIDDSALEFGGFGGVSQYYGDISEKNYFQKLSGETTPSFGFYGRFHFNGKHGLGLGFNRISHYSRKDTYSNGNPLNNDFTGHSNAFFLHSYLNMSNLFWGVAERKAYIYGTLGLGYNSWQSTRRNTLTGNIIIDYTNAGANNLRSEAFYFPAALGVKFKISPALSLFIEGIFNTIISDDIDYYRDGYQYDILVQTHLGLSYRLPLYASAPRQAPSKNTETSQPRRSTTMAPIYVIDYENFPVLPGEQVHQHQLPVLEPPKQMEVAIAQPQPSSDVEFRVQIYAASRKISNPQGLFRNIQFENPIIENVANGLYRYSTGSFRTYSEAEAYAKRLQSRGIHDAFVVAYRNNIRIPVANEMKR